MKLNITIPRKAAVVLETKEVVKPVTIIPTKRTIGGKVVKFKKYKIVECSDGQLIRISRFNGRRIMETLDTEDVEQIENFFNR